VAGIASGISLWLVPEPASARALAEIIDRLADRLGTPRFPPHLTLQGGVRADAPTVIGQARALAQRLQPFEVRLLTATTRAEFFRCVVLEADSSPVLLAAREAAALALGQPDSPFEPHVSLVYGALAADARAAALRELPPWPARIGFEALEVHHTEGVVANWRRLESLSLGGVGESGIGA
jgi:2'-5' RNA ligase